MFGYVIGACTMYMNDDDRTTPTTGTYANNNIDFFGGRINVSRHTYIHQYVTSPGVPNDIRNTIGFTSSSLFFSFSMSILHCMRFDLIRFIQTKPNNSSHTKSNVCHFTRAIKLNRKIHTVHSQFQFMEESGNSNLFD